MAPRGVERSGRVGALRAIDSLACPRSWQAYGPRRFGSDLSLPWWALYVVRHRHQQHAKSFARLVSRVLLEAKSR